MRKFEFYRNLISNFSFEVHESFTVISIVIPLRFFGTQKGIKGKKSKSQLFIKTAKNRIYSIFREHPLRPQAESGAFSEDWSIIRNRHFDIF